MALRPTTNLKIDPDLQLPKSELKSGFLYVYNKGYKHSEALFISRLWTCVMFPELQESPRFGSDKKRLRLLVDKTLKKLPAGYTSVKKINSGADSHFEISVPVFRFPDLVTEEIDESVTLLKNSLTPATAAGENTVVDQSTYYNALEEAKANLEGNSYRFPASQVIAALRDVDGKGKLELGKCLLGVRLRAVGTSRVVFIDFKISQKEAEQLTTTPWVMIRNIDIYPLIMMWASNYYGFLQKAPLASFPVSKIAKTLPKVEKGQARVNEHGLSIDAQGRPYYLPEALDNTARYEDLFLTAGSMEDGSFSLINSADVSESGEDAAVKLPKNIPVLIDWVNNKFAYTQNNGTMRVQDLTRFKPADVTHAVNILKRTSLDTGMLRAIVNLGSVAGVDPKIKLTPEESADIQRRYPAFYAQIEKGTVLDDPAIFFSAFKDAFIAMKNAQIKEENPGDFQDRLLNAQSRVFTLYDVSPNGEAVLRPVSRYLIKAVDAIKPHLDAVYVKYSVSHVSQYYAYTILMAKYASNKEAIELEDVSNRKAAINQKVDENWELPSIPLLKKPNPDGTGGIGFLPHQKKVRNLLKDSPDFAILPVQAGGGKSILAITDVLCEIKANRSQPYLILCPSHLVAQYVKEIVFFTGGKLNAIAINSYTVRKNGYKRLTAMLESAPRNTVVVADYDSLRIKAEQVCYGTTTITVFPVIEFLRQFGFGYAMLDESHSVKNDTARTRACMALIADIKKKRLASGTMSHDSPSDLAIQISMLDPTLFGSRDEFNERFGAEVSGDRVLEWKPGAQKQIMEIIRSRVVVAGAMRKEWAALLPHANEEFHVVDLTPAQQEVYRLIFEDTMEKLKEAAKTNPKLAAFLNSGADAPPTEETDSESETDDDITSLLNPYLARLEMYVTAPSKDPLGDKMLMGDDRLSPKVRKIVERVRLHLDKNYEGKVLIFTNYTSSAEEIFEQFPPDLKQQALLYVAAEKVEAGTEFEKNPNKKIMVGVENSMNTGLNLQHVSRLIRVETVWNPGTLEQGNSRVNRPELKKADRRDQIWYDWIMADRTIDITKISRLISKLVTTAKFENADSPAYETIPDVPVMRMTLDTVEVHNSWSETLEDYALAYRQYVTVRDADYADYRQKHGDLVMAPIPVAENPKDAALMPQVPYTPGLEVFNESKLGLVRVDAWLRTTDVEEEGDSDSEDGDSEVSEKDAAKIRLMEAANALKGQIIHSEFGEVEVKGVQLGARTLIVAVKPDFEVRIRMSTAFMVPPNVLDKGPVKKQILEAIGMPVSERVKVIPENFKFDKTAARRAAKLALLKEKEDKKKRKEQKAQLQVELYLNVTNGFLGLSYFTEEGSETGNALQALGFRPSPQFIYAEVANAPRLLKQFQLWRDAGFTMNDSMDISAAFKDLHTMLKNGKISSHMAAFNFATRNDLKNFYRMEFKPSINKKEIKPFPMIEDNKAFIVLPVRGQASTLPATRIKAPGIKWMQSEPSLVYYGLSKGEVSKMVRSILDAGIQITNIKDLSKDFKRAQKLKVREG